MKAFNFIYTILFLVIVVICLGCSRSSFNSQKSLDSLDGVPNEFNSSLEVTDNNVADGITAAVVTIKVMDVKKSPVSNMEVQISVSGSENVITPCPKSDSNGLSRCQIYSTRSEKKMVKLAGKLNFAVETMFSPPRAEKSGAAIVSAGISETVSSGHRMIVTAGVPETPAQLLDNSNVQRAQTSIQAVLVSED